MSPLPPSTADANGEQPRIAVVLVNWHGWQDTLAAYESLKASTYPNWTAVVVENGSTDDSPARLRGDRPQYILVESPTNRGFAGACNLGVEAARAWNADYVYFLNNDATAGPDTIQALLDASRSLNDQTILGSVIRFADDNRLQFWGSHRSSGGLPIWNARSEELFAQAPELIDSDFIMGASLFAPMPILDKVGDFDERFFLNFEETDWCYRAGRAGHRCVVVKTALAFHKGGATIGAPYGPMQVYFMRRNVLLLAERHCTRKQFAILYVRQLFSVFRRLLGSRSGKATDPRLSKPASKANALATLDYTFRRFGDCPPIIRKMAAEARASH